MWVDMVSSLTLYSMSDNISCNLYSYQYNNKRIIVVIQYICYDRWVSHVSSISILDILLDTSPQWWVVAYHCALRLHDNSTLNKPVDGRCSTDWSPPVASHNPFILPKNFPKHNWSYPFRSFVERRGTRQGVNRPLIWDKGGETRKLRMYLIIRCYFGSWSIGNLL